MATPFVPVPVPMERALSGTSNPRRPQRASSLGSASSSSESSSTKGPGDESSSGRRGNSIGASGSERSCFTPPCQSPFTRARMNGLDPTVEYSSCPRPDTPPQTPSWEERPITPTVLGYEVMEERAKFTVYKILVRKSQEETWVVFRRYTDFSRLNDKLKEMFPGFRLSLPPKRWFKDNYNTDFLEDRQLGLQAFLQNLVAHKDIANCYSLEESNYRLQKELLEKQREISTLKKMLEEKELYIHLLEKQINVAVREFLCLDDPPGPFDSLEESRAFCETLEESNYRLQKELLEKQREISTLKKMLEEKELYIHLLEKRINGESLTPESPCALSAQGSESSVDADGEVESSTAEADQDMPEENGCEKQAPRSSSSCWCGPAISRSPPVIQVTQLEK